MIPTRCACLSALTSGVSRCRMRPQCDKFCYLLEAHDLGERLFAAEGEHLQAQGLRISTDTLVDAAIINAPALTKSQDGRKHTPNACKAWQQF